MERKQRMNERTTQQKKKKMETSNKKIQIPIYRKDEAKVYAAMDRVYIRNDQDSKKAEILIQ